MERPEIILFDSEPAEEAAARDLARTVTELGIENPLVVHSVFGRLLARRIPTRLAREIPIPNANQEWTAALGRSARKAGVDAIVAVGGGRCLDIAKLAAARAGAIVLAAPTQLSHDGICSPVAVVPNQTGSTESLGAIAPRVVYLSIPTLLNAPLDSVRAGLGDLLANPLALRDWALAADRGLETVDERAWELSLRSFEVVRPYFDTDVAAAAAEPEFLARLADGLATSGLAMIVAGNSRPASGAEHEISHAIDQLYGGRALHGAQVGFGCVVSAALYGDDAGAWRRRLRKLGLPDSPARLGLSEDDMVKVLLAAPDTRPGRFTMLEDAALDEGSALDLVRHIWDDEPGAFAP